MLGSPFDKMNIKLSAIYIFLAGLILFSTADAQTDSAPAKPHTPTLIFYLTYANSQNDLNYIHYTIKQLKSAELVQVNTSRGYARIQFDSHVVSYHQVAQAIVDAGELQHKEYDPCLIFTVPDYSKGDNAAKVDAIFAGKRLNQRVQVTPLNKAKGQFLIHFLPLKVDAAVSGPQGFNGGHLHHPISDPAPQGLGLVSEYSSQDDPSISVPPQAPSTQPANNP